MIDIFEKKFRRVYGSGWKCVTPFLDMLFECENEESISNILTVNIMFSEEFKKVSGVLKNGCFILAMKFQIR